MKKLLIFLAVLALCMPAYAEILTYKTSIRGTAFDFGAGKMVKVKRRGYLVVDVNVNDMAVQDAYHVSYDKRGKEQSPEYVDLQFTLVQSGKRHFISAQYQSNDTTAILNSKAKDTKIGTADKEIVAKSLKGFAVFKYIDMMGSGKMTARLHRPWTKEANEEQKELGEAVADIREYMEGKGYSETFVGIQAAINAANTGDTVTIPPGTYNVDTMINVNKIGLTLAGAGAGSTIVSGSTKNGSILNGHDVLFNVTADEVTIKNMTIDLGDDDTDFDVGILTPNAGGIDNLTVQNCTLLYADYGAPAGKGEQLIHLGGGSGATITENTLDVASSNSMLYVGDGDNTLLTVSDNIAAPVAAAASGAGDPDGGGTFFNQFGPVTYSNISGNTFTDTGIAVYLGAGTSATHDVLVINNTFTSTSGYLGLYGALIITSEVDGVNTYNITITGNDFTGTESSGAITIFDTVNPATPNVDGSTITINNNNFMGDNTGGGVIVGSGVSGTPVDAENNWWGDPSGPGPVGPGAGDGVSANVDYDPWKTQLVP